MKKYFIIIGVFVLLLSSCNQNDMILYDQEPRIDFQGYSNTGDEKLGRLTEFNDADYLNQVAEKIDSVKVIIMGHALLSPLAYCLTTEKDTTTNLGAQVRFASEYIFPAGVFISWAKYTVKRPELCGKSYKANLVFDVKNPAHQFASGRVEARKMGCLVEFNLEPIEGWNTKLWNATFLGMYSDGKYKFMMDTYKKTYKEFTVDATLKNDVRAKYAVYKAGGGAPIMDDQEKPEEIVFPL